MQLNTAITKMEAIKAEYEAALPYHRRRVVCPECGTEYIRKETECEEIKAMKKMCECRADGKVMDAERRKLNA